MPRNKACHISAQVDLDFFMEMKEYCHRNQCSLASLITTSVRKTLSNDWEIDILRKCEKLIDSKAGNTISVKAKRVKV